MKGMTHRYSGYTSTMYPTKYLGKEDKIKIFSSLKPYRYYHTGTAFIVYTLCTCKMIIPFGFLELKMLLSHAKTDRYPIFISRIKTALPSVSPPVEPPPS